MSDTTLDNARQMLLDPGGIELRDVEHVLGQLSGQTVDLADLYFEHTRSESWSLEDGLVKDGAHAIDQGVGVRAVSGEKTGFAYCDELAIPALEQAAQAVRAIGRQGQDRHVRVVSAVNTPALYAPVDPLTSIPTETKLTLLKSLDERLRSADPRVREVMVSLTGRYSEVLIAASDGTLAGDQRPLVRLNVNVIVEHNGRR